jgi:hypothetical protein
MGWVDRERKGNGLGRQREEGKGVGQKEIGRVGGWVDRERKGRGLGRKR